MRHFKEEENLINKKKVKNFLNSKINSMEIEIRAEEFLNARVQAFLKKIIEDGFIATKNRKGKILQDKDLRFNLFKSTSLGDLGLSFWKKNNFLVKKSIQKKRKKRKIQIEKIFDLKS